MVVGESTAGAANPGTDRRIHEHFTAFIPFGRAVSPVTGTNWERTGVQPDMPAPTARALLARCSRAARALLVVHRDAIARALQHEPDAHEATRLRAVLTDVEHDAGTAARP